MPGRRRLAAAAVAVIVCLLPLAAAGPAVAVPAKKDITLTLTQLPAQVRLLAGESIRLRLSTNRTTGYSWSTKVTGMSGAVRVSDGTYAAPSAGLVGAPGTTTWTITARGTGVAKVRILTTPPGGGAATTVGVLTVFAGAAVAVR